jgi:ABC-2 type transport system ATP-binding protein
VSWSWAVADGPPLRLEGVTKRYPGDPEVVALAGIDLVVGSGEILGLLGPNGAGKSTTIGIATTRVRPTTGRVAVLGTDALRHPARVKRDLGVVTQSNTLDRSLDLWENLYYHCRYFGWGRAAAKRRADELIDAFRLWDRRHAMPMQVSGGMAQRMQIARAIAHRPALLFLDEPTAGLDPQSRLALWELVEGLRDDGISVLLSTHYMEEADRLCDRVAIIDHGRILVCDTPERLKSIHGSAVVVDVSLAATPLGPLIEALRALSTVVAVETEGSRLRIVGQRSDGLVAAVVGVVTLHADLVDLSVTGSSLESAFIGLTGRDLRD